MLLTILQEFRISFEYCIISRYNTLHTVINRLHYQMVSRIKCRKYFEDMHLAIV